MALLDIQVIVDIRVIPATQAIQVIVDLLDTLVTLDLQVIVDTQDTQAIQVQVVKLV